MYRSSTISANAIRTSNFLGNAANQHGGAIYDQDTNEDSTIAGNYFKANKSPQGEGVMLRQAATQIGQNTGLPSTDVVSVTYADEASSGLGEYDYEESPNADYGDASNAALATGG